AERTVERGFGGARRPGRSHKPGLREVAYGVRASLPAGAAGSGAGRVPPFVVRSSFPMLARSKLVPFLLALVPCAAQPPATFPAPPEILAHYALRDGTVQNLVLPWQASGPFSVR